MKLAFRLLSRGNVIYRANGQTYIHVFLVNEAIFALYWMYAFHIVFSLLSSHRYFSTFYAYSFGIRIQRRTNTAAYFLDIIVYVLLDYLL